MGHNTDEKVYTNYDFNAAGGAQYSQGTVVGDTWTLIGSLKMGGEWVTIMEGKSTKTP
jgi:hypothetical protein